MILSAALLLASALPDFAFKEFRGAGVYSPEGLVAAGCVEEAPRDYSCQRRDSVAGQYAYIEYRIYQSRLVWLRVSGLREAIPEVLPQLNGKYGEPCERGSERVSNALGGEAVSETLTWCFLAGRMVFRERDARMDAYSLTYTSYVQPPARAIPPQDF